MGFFSKLFGGKTVAPASPYDEVEINGRKLRLTFFAHASVAIEYEGRHIYVDPVVGHADYASLPKADMILVTHSHYDHFDMAADGTGGAFSEFAMLTLRLTEGLKREVCAERFQDGGTLYDAVLENAKKLPKPLVLADSEKISLTAEGFLVSNMILAEILPEE